MVSGVPKKSLLPTVGWGKGLANRAEAWESRRCRLGE